MEKLIINEQFAGILTASQSGFELFDSSNRRLGFFIPSAESDAELYAQAKQFWTDEEVEQLSKQSGGISTEELLRRLPQL